MPAAYACDQLMVPWPSETSTPSTVAGGEQVVTSAADDCSSPVVSTVPATSLQPAARIRIAVHPRMRAGMATGVPLCSLGKRSESRACRRFLSRPWCAAAANGRLRLSDACLHGLEPGREQGGDLFGDGDALGLHPRIRARDQGAAFVAAQQPAALAPGGRRVRA